ncbi:hemagglutinin repeat-containing protein [Brenneria goodwinii]|uniref:hemagglutinin repeat-containing protein n=1 Tax=Brenneria goodwinii TaxID=1109412 RepID=UPI0036E57971
MKPIKTTQRLMAYTLINLIAFQPVLPAMAAGINVANGNTAVDKAGNGVPVVNIATPNSAGISHNQYHDFNVDKSGLILNNGTAQLNPTQLGGLIQNNPNLKGKAADAIINEVVSPNRSTLAGYLEVGGKQASVMVANPYGITCDGCGFINTPQVTLTTGKPQFDAQGKLQGIDVKRGDILLTGQGLDASKSDYLSLISRTAQINAGLNANDAQVVIGANQIDANGNVTAQAAENGDIKVALDTGALGGMYTNRITLVSNDKGVGVNVGNLSARSGDITLSANGKLSVGDAVAQGNIHANGEALALQGKQQAGGELTLEGNSGIALTDATLRAGQSVTLASEGEMNATDSRINAGVDTQGALISGHHLTIKSDNVTINNTQLAADNVAIKAGGALRQDALSGIKADSELGIQGKDITLSGIAEAQAIQLEAETLTATRSAQLQAKNSATVSATQQGDWQGNLTSGDALTLQGGQIVQGGTLAGKTLTLNVDSLDNQGDIASLQGLSLVGNQLINSGSLSAAQQLTLKAGSVDNVGLLSARGDLQLELQTLLNNQGKILTENHLFMLADSVANQGTIQAATLALQSTSFTNQGEVTASQNIDLNNQAIDNHGTINAQQRVNLSGGAALNSGTLSAGASLAATLNTGLNNSGMLLAGKTLAVAAGDVINDGTLTAPELQIQSDSLDNQGIIQADNSLTISADRQLVQRAGGKLLAGEALTLSAAQAETDGELQAKQFLLNADRWLNQSKTSIGGDAQATAYSLDNSGSLLAQGRWLLSGNVIVNQGILQGERLDLRANNITNSGQAQSLQSSMLHAHDSLINTGDWLSGDALSLNALAIDNSGNLRALTTQAQSDRFSNRGQISGIQHLDLHILDRLDNQGTLEGQSIRLDAIELDNQGTLLGVDALTLSITNTLNNQGELFSQGESTSTARQIDNQGQWQAQTLTLNADTITNAGKILGIEALTLTAKDTLTNQQAGKLLSQGMAVLTAADTANAGDWLAASLTLEAGNLTNSGRIQAEQALMLRGDNLSNTGRWESDIIQLFGKTVTNQGTLLGNHVGMTADSLINDGKITGADELTLILDQHLFNRGDLNGERLSVDAAGVNNLGGLFGVDDLQLNLRGDLDNAGTLSGKTLALTAENVRQSGTLEGYTVRLNAGMLDNQGKMLGVDALTLAIRSSLHNSGALLSQGDNTVTAQSVDNLGQWQAKDITLTADEIANAGQIAGIAALQLTASHSLLNLQSGKLLTQGVATLQAADTLNEGEWQAGNLLLETQRFTNEGWVQGDRSLKIAVISPDINQQSSLALALSLADDTRALSTSAPAGTLLNNGTLISAGDSQLTATQINNQGVLSSNGSAVLTGDNIRNDGDVAAATSLSLVGNYQGEGRLKTDGTLALRGESLHNAGQWEGDSLQLDGLSLNNQGSLLGNTINVMANNVVNHGEMAGIETLQLTLGDGLQNQGSLYGAALTLTATDLFNHGDMSADNRLTLELNDTLQNTGDIYGNLLAIHATRVANDGALTGVGGLSFNLAENLTNNGDIASRALSLTAENLTNQGNMLGVDALTLAISGSARNQGKWLSQGNSALTAEQVENLGQWQADSLEMSAGQVTNSGQILGLSSLALTTTGELINQQDGKLLSQGVAILNAASVTNHGEWLADNLALNAKNLTNTGRIQGNRALAMTLDPANAGRLLNQGILVSGGSSQLAASQIDNQGIISGHGDTVLISTETRNDGNILAVQSLSLHGSYQGNGLLNTDGTLTLRGSHLRNAGYWESRALALVGDTVDNQGTILGNRADITAKTLSNDGDITGVNELILTLDDTLNNQGSLNSYLLGVSANRLINQGQMNGVDGLTVSLNDRLDNQGFLYGAALTIDAHDLINVGDITGIDSLKLNIAQTLNNTGTLNSNLLTADAAQGVNDGQITGVNGLSLSFSGDLNNQGELNSHSLLMRADSLANAGKINATHDLRLFLNGTLDNSGGLNSQRLAVTAVSALNSGQILGIDDLQLKLKDELDNSGLISGNNMLNVTAKRINQRDTLEGRTLHVQADELDNQGKMLGVDALTLAISGTARNQGKWLSQGNGSVTAERVENLGQWQADTIDTAANQITNSGLIFALSAMKLSANGDLVNQQDGKLLSLGNAVFNAADAVNDGDWQAQYLSLAADNFTNGGRVQGDKGLAVTLDPSGSNGIFTNQGVLISGGDSQLSVGRLDNRGTLSSNGYSAISSAAIRNDGNVVATDGLSLNGEYQGNGLLYTAGVLALHGDRLGNTGRWESRILQLTGQSFDNQGTIVGERGLELDLTDELTVGAAGQLLTGGELLANVGNVSNQGFWQGNLLSLTADALRNDGTLVGQNRLQLALQDSYQGNDRSQLLSDGDTTLTANRVIQSGEIAANNLQLNTGSLDNAGRVLGLTHLQITNQEEITNRKDGEILTNGDGVINSTRFNNSGRVQANDLRLSAERVENQGRIQGTSALRLLNLNQYIGDKTSQLLSGGGATIQAQQADNLGLWQADNLSIDVSSLINSGTLAGLNSLSFAGNQISNQGDIFSQGALALSGAIFDNAGTVTGIGGFDLQFTDFLLNQSTGRLLNGGVGAVNTDKFINQGLWQSDDLQLIAGELDNQGQMLGVKQATLRLSGDYQGAADSQLVSGGNATLTAANINNRGQIQALELDVTANSLTNQGTLRGNQNLDATVKHQLSNAQNARLVSDGALNVQANAIDNQGTINAADLTLHGNNSLKNNGVLQGATSLQLETVGKLTNQQAGQILSDGTATLKAAALDNAGWLQGRELDVQTQQFTQQGSLIAQDKVTLRIPQWVNQGLIQAQHTEIIADVLENQGTLLGLTQLALQTHRLINQQGGKIYSAQDLSLKTDELQQNGQLLALGNLTADISGPLTFTQLLAAGNRLTLNVAGDLDQRGTLQGQSVVLASAGKLTNQGNILAGDGDSRITAQTIEQQEAGSIQAGGNLSLVSENDIHNRGLIGATGDLLMQAGAALNNTSLLYAGGNMRLFSDGLRNVFGNILVGNNLWIQRDEQGNASTAVLNSSGTIETQSGDITITTGTLTNQREGLVVTETKLAADSVPDWAGQTTANIPIEWFKPEDFGIATFKETEDKGINRIAYYAYYVPYEHADIQKVAIVSQSIDISVQGDAGKIGAGKGLFIASKQLTNEASQLLAAKDIIFSGNILNNQSYQTGFLTEYLLYEYQSKIKYRPNEHYSNGHLLLSEYILRSWDYKNANKYRYIPYVLSGTPTYEQTIGESYNALIQAGGTITADFKEDISNTTLQPGSDGFIPATVTPVLASTLTLSPLQKQTTRQLVGNDASLNTDTVNLINSGVDAATLGHSASAVSSTAKNVSLSQVTEPRLQPGVQAEQISAATIALENAEPQSLTKNDALVLQKPGQVDVEMPGQTSPGAAEPIALSNTGLIPQQSPGLSIDGPTQTNIEKPQSVTLNTEDAAVSTVITLEKPGAVNALITDDATTPINIEASAPFSHLSAAELMDSIGNGLQALSSSPLADYPLPAGNNGLLVVDPNSDSRYLIHTNPKLEQLGQVDNSLFNDLQSLLGQQPSTTAQVETRSQWTQADNVLGSSYLLDKLNLDADHDYRFLGDAEFDTRYISNAVLSQSGKRYLDGTGSDLSQMQKLMDNAAAAQKGLDLQLGVSLTPDQVANLSESIVWWENIEVNGQSVLAPKLYLAQADKNNVQGSAIVANQVNLSAGGSVTNSGTISAVELLAIASGDKIDNQEGGLLKSDGSLNLVALNNITNSSSRIEGDTLQLASINGDIINKTESRQWQTSASASPSSGTGSLTFTELGKTAAISATNSLTMAAGHDIRNVAATLSAGEDMALNAANNVSIEALTLTNNRLDQSWNRSQSSLSTAVQGSQLSAEGTLQANAGNNIQIDASMISGGAGLSLTAANDIQLTAQQTLEETLNRNGGSAAQRRTQAIESTQLLSGGDLDLLAGRDVLSEATSLNAKGDATLAAGRDLNLLSAEEESYSGNWWKRHADWQQNITQQGTELTAGEGLILQAGRDINLQAAQGIAGGALTAQAGNDINLLSATETQHTFFEETKVKKKTFSKTVTHTVRDHFSTEEKGSLLSGDSVVLQADNDINVKGSAITGDSIVALKAGNDVDITASIEEQRDYEKQTKKKSGLMSGGGIGFTIGKQSSSAEYNGAETRQSEARSLMGAADGNVVIQAGKDVSVTGSDIIAARNTQTDDNSRGNIDILAENIAITSGQDTRDITTRFETKSSGISLSLKGTPYDSYQNLRDIAQTDGATSRVRLFIGETAAMIFDAPQIAVSVGSTSSKTEQHTQGIYQIGSSLTAAGNIQLQAIGDSQQDGAGKVRSGDILVSGSAVHAGENVLLNATRGITLQSASDTERSDRKTTSSGWSLSNAIPGIGSAIRHISGGPNNGVGMIPFASENARETQQSDTLAQTASTVSGQTVTLNSHNGDIHIAGAAVTGVEDVFLQAQNGNVVIQPGQNSASSETTGSRKTIGDLGGDGYSGTVGWQSSLYHSVDEVNQQSTLRSHIQSGEGDIGVVAKEDIVIAGADLQAGKSLLLSGRDITLNPAIDTEYRLREQQSSQYGVTTALSGYAVSAVQALERLSQSVEDKRDPRLSAIYAAQAALNLATQTTVTDMNSAAVKVTISAGGGSSQSSQQKESVTREGSTLYAGEDIQLAAERDITAIGTDIRGRNIKLAAGNNMNLASAQNEESVTESSSGSRAGVGVGFGLGGQQNGFTVELSASNLQEKKKGNGQTHQLTQVNATDTVKLVSGADTVLSGAIVTGQRAEADIGGDLLIRSSQNMSTYDSKNTSAGLNVSICVPPICGGQTVTGNANLSQQILNNRYASVLMQSGIRAGTDGFDIQVGHHIQLDGAVLASEAEEEKNRLSTGTLGWRDIANISDYKGTGFSVGVSTDSMPVAGLEMVQDKQTGITHSAVAPAVINIRDAGGQQQDIANLSRDTDGANDSIEDGFDRSKIEDKLAIQKEATALGVQALNAYKEHKKTEAEAQARARLSREGVPDEEIDARIRASDEVKQVEQDYGVGGRYWTAGTTLTAALSGGLGGNVNGAVAGAAAPYLAELVKDVSQGNEPARIALHTVLGAFLAQSQGGSALGGAAGGLTSAVAAEMIAKVLYPGVETEKLSDEQKQLVANLVVIAGAGAAGLSDGNLASVGSGANTAKNEVENNYLSSSDKDRQTYLNHKQNLTPEEQKDKEALNRKDLESDLAFLNACQQSGKACDSEKDKAKEALNTYFNQTYQNPKEAQAGYQQIQNLLNSIDPNAKAVFNVLEGYTQAFMTFGYTEEEARARAGAYVGSMYIAGGVSAVVASGALTKQFGKDVAPGAKPGSSTAKPIENVPNSSETYFRVEGGGNGTQTSQNRINVNSDGSVTINSGCSGQLCVSTNGPNHAAYYLTNRRQDGSVVVFEVDAALHKQIMDAAVPQRPIPGVPKDPDAPKIVDPTKGQPSVSLELPKVWDRLIEQNSSKARVLTKEEFLNEFNK